MERTTQVNNKTEIESEEEIENIKEEIYNTEQEIEKIKEEETEEENSFDPTNVDQEIDSIFNSEVPFEDSDPFFGDFNQSENYANFSQGNLAFEISIIKPPVLYIPPIYPMLIRVPKEKDFASPGQMKILRPQKLSLWSRHLRHLMTS